MSMCDRPLLVGGRGGRGDNAELAAWRNDIAVKSQRRNRIQRGKERRKGRGNVRAKAWGGEDEAT